MSPRCPACVRARRAIRVLDELACEVAADSGRAPKSEILKRVVGSISEARDALDLLLETVPEEEYHFDPSRPPTTFMTEVNALISKSEIFARQGDLNGARRLLSAALEMEPPSIVWERISERLAELSGGGAGSSPSP